MPTILLGFDTLLVLLWVVGAAARADPKGFVRGARLAGGVAALGGAACGRRHPAPPWHEEEQDAAGYPNIEVGLFPRLRLRRWRSH